MTVLVEGKHGFYIGSRAIILDHSYEKAWAEKHVIHNDAHSYILGKFVEADQANSNGQYFQMAGLRMAQPTIAHSPMNIDHDPRKIVGAFVASDFVHPTQSEGASNPYIEALGVFWKAHFQEEWAKVKEAHDNDGLFFSMECVPGKIGCIGDGGCGQVFEYAGQTSPTYCEHINNRTADRDLIDPHFTGGAILLPPVRPGWSEANIHSLLAQHAASNDAAREEISEESDDLSVSEWESMYADFMASVSVFRGHDVPADELAESGLKVPNFVQKNAQRGLDYLAEGFGGDGLRPQTIADARRMVKGSVSRAKIRRIGPWIARHTVDLDAPQNSNSSDPQYPGNGLVAMLLWGAGPDKEGARRTREWAERESAKLDGSEDAASRDLGAEA